MRVLQKTHQVKVKSIKLSKTRSTTYSRSLAREPYSKEDSRTKTVSLASTLTSICPNYQRSKGLKSNLKSKRSRHSREKTSLLRNKASSPLRIHMNHKGSASRQRNSMMTVLSHALRRSFVSTSRSRFLPERLLRLTLTCLSC